MKIHIILLGRISNINISNIKLALSNSRYWEVVWGDNLSQKDLSKFGKYNSKINRLGKQLNKSNEMLMNELFSFMRELIGIQNSDKIVAITKKRLFHNQSTLTNNADSTIISLHNWNEFYPDIPQELFIVKEVVSSSLLFSRTVKKKKVIHQQIRGCLFDEYRERVLLRTSLWGNLCVNCRSHFTSLGVSKIKQDEAILILRSTFVGCFDHKKILSMLKSPRVFVSYAKEDTSKAERIALALEKSGFQTWIDTWQLYAGDCWEDKIYQAMNETDFIVLCISVTSIRKVGFVQKELNVALNLRDLRPQKTAFIIPVRLDDCSVPSALEKIHYIDLFPKFNQALNKLIESIQKHYSDLSKSPILKNSAFKRT